MNQMYWHKVNDFDFPHPFKQILILLDNDVIFLGWYEGECKMLPWNIPNYGNMASFRIKAWCNIPDIPDELRSDYDKK